MSTIDRYRKIGIEAGFWKNGLFLEGFFFQALRENNFSGMNFLEIGCGNGMYCIWASLHGAKHVVGLEPMAAGSALVHQKAIYKFERACRELKLENIDYIEKKIQDYDCKEHYFDILFLNNSINHLSERHCANLTNSSESKKIYHAFLKKLASITKIDGKIIIIDVSSRNFWGDLKIKNPFAGSIEWQKHQPPEVWSHLLSGCGFVHPKIFWMSNKMLRIFKFYSISSLAAYFAKSKFRLEMTLSSTTLQ